MVTGEARASLSATGQFALDAPAQNAGEISADRARELAIALVKTYTKDSLGGLPLIGKEHGASVDQTAVLPCRRTIYARSPWEPLHPAIAATVGGAVVQRAHGSWWLVPFCDATGNLVMLVSVSVFATDLTVKDGIIVYPRIGGEWFHWNGVPQGQHDELPVGPETAAVLAANLTGRQVTAVPDFEAPSRREGFPAAGHWRIQLDTPGATHQRADHSGAYPGGLGGLNSEGAVNDIAMADFTVKPQYGTQAYAEALLRYKFDLQSLQTQKITPSFSTKVKPGVKTWLAVVPQVDENYYNARSYQWYFDNSRVIDTANTRDPRYPAYPGIWFQAKVNSPGTHTWKVIFKYGHRPSTPTQEYTVTKTWTQTWP